ncbi:hypothetical protein BH10ACI3_BH10ACI3_03940 [soil metagenome]
MKQCPRCNHKYIDEDLNFCLEDGEMLTTVFNQTERYVDDSPPTIALNDARRTNPTNWPQSPPSAPPAQWQQPQMQAQPVQFGSFPVTQSPNQTLAIVSLGLGIGSLAIGWCCSLGLLLSPAALITGFIALSNIKKDPNANGGRGLAIAGIVTGTIFLSAYILFLILYGVAVIGGGLFGGN